MGETITGIYERNDIALRTREGLPEYKGWYLFDGIPRPESAVTEICENGIKYLVDVENGQKTGFFLDQKYNRAAVARIAKGKRVLDCFTHTGSFGLNAALGGAEHVTCVDISQSAIDMAKANAVRNGLDGKWILSVKMFLICSQNWQNKNAMTMIISFLTRRLLPNPARRCSLPPADIKKLTSKP